MKVVYATLHEHEQSVLCEEPGGSQFWCSSEELVQVTPMTTAPDLVNQPPHYTTGGIETIDFIRAKQLDYCLGNVVKYITRAPHKGNEVQDLKKARWYLDRAISERKDNLNKERDQ